MKLNDVSCKRLSIIFSFGTNSAEDALEPKISSLINSKNLFHRALLKIGTTSARPKDDENMPILVSAVANHTG